MPAIKRIQRWKGLSDYRNVAAAHTHRDKEKKFVPWPEALDIHKVPSSYVESVILGNCAIETITEFTNEFSEEFVASKPRLNAILPVPVRRGFRIRELVELELAEVQRQMELERSRIKKKKAK